MSDEISVNVQVQDNVQTIAQVQDSVQANVRAAEMLNYDPPTVTVGTTTTGEAGTSASVTNSGTDKDVVLNFTIPKGDKGDQGDPGEVTTEQLTQGLSGRADKDLSNLSATGESHFVQLQSGVSQANVDYVVESYVNGTSWYRVYKSGWCEQGGYISSLATNYTQYTLLKEYKDTSYSVVASYAGINGDTANFSSVSAIPAKPYDTEHIIIGMYGNTQSCFWEAKGYIA